MCNLYCPSHLYDNKFYLLEKNECVKDCPYFLSIDFKFSQENMIINESAIFSINKNKIKIYNKLKITDDLISCKSSITVYDESFQAIKDIHFNCRLPINDWNHMLSLI
jgi:hypothetical protein